MAKATTENQRDVDFGQVSEFMSETRRIVEANGRRSDQSRIALNQRQRPLKLSRSLLKRTVDISNQCPILFSPSRELANRTGQLLNWSRFPLSRRTTLLHERGYLASRSRVVLSGSTNGMSSRTGALRRSMPSLGSSEGLPRLDLSSVSPRTLMLDSSMLS